MTAIIKLLPGNSDYYKHVAKKAALSPFYPLGSNAGSLFGLFASCLLTAAAYKGTKYFNVKILTDAAPLPIVIGVYFALATLHFAARLIFHSPKDYYQGLLVALARGDNISDGCVYFDSAIPAIKARAKALNAEIARQKELGAIGPDLEDQMLFDILLSRYTIMPVEGSPAETQSGVLRESEVKKSELEARQALEARHHAAFEDFLKSFISLDSPKTNGLSQTLSSTPSSPIEAARVELATLCEEDQNSYSKLSELSFRLLKHLALDSSPEELEKYKVAIPFLVRQIKDHDTLVNDVAVHFSRSLTSDEIDDDTFNQKMEIFDLVLFNLKFQSVESKPSFFNEALQITLDATMKKALDKSQDQTYISRRVIPLAQLLVLRESPSILYKHSTGAKIHLVDIAVQFSEFDKTFLTWILGSITPKNKDHFNGILSRSGHTLLTDMILKSHNHALLNQTNITALDFDAEDKVGNTPLIAAIKWGQKTDDYRLVDDLLSQGVRVNKQNREGKTALHILIEGNNPAHRDPLGNFDLSNIWDGESTEPKKRWPHFSINVMVSLILRDANLDIRDYAQISPRDMLKRFPNLQRILAELDANIL